MTDSSRPTETPQRVVRETPARQGRYGRHMMWVLLGGLFLVIAAFAALWAYRAGDFAASNSNNGPANIRSPAGPDPAQAFHAPEPAAVTPPPGTDHTAPGPAQRAP